MAFGEGSRFSVRDSDWLGYVGDELAELNTHYDLKLPLWSQDAGKQTYSWILQTPTTTSSTSPARGAPATERPSRIQQLQPAGSHGGASERGG